MSLYQNLTEFKVSRARSYYNGISVSSYLVVFRYPLQCLAVLRDLWINRRLWRLWRLNPKIKGVPFFFRNIFSYDNYELDVYKSRPGFLTPIVNIKPQFRDSICPDFSIVYFLCDVLPPAISTNYGTPILGHKLQKSVLRGLYENVHGKKSFRTGMCFSLTPNLTYHHL